MKHLSDNEIDDFFFWPPRKMYGDGYFPNGPVERLREILVNVCREIEEKESRDLKELYAITHRATELINDLQQDFAEEESEIETVARDSIAVGFEKIAEVYGFDADIEELVAPREW